MRGLIRALIRSGDTNLFDRAMSAGFWAAALRLTVRGSLLVRTVILARLLVPDDFGLMAIAAISILFVENVTESGVGPALVQKRGAVEKYLDTAWTMQIVRALLTCAIIAGGAPYIASFFGAPEAQTIIRVLAISVILKGLTNIGVVRFIKELRFDRHFTLEIAGRGTEFIVSIALAFMWRSVWALVVGVLAGAVARLITSYLIDDYRPHLRWVWPQVKSLLSFGKWILVSNIVVFSVNNLDDVLVGRYLGVTSLGLYRMAYNLSQAVASEIMATANQVSFPTYAKLQGSRDRLRSAYMGSLHIVAFLGFPIAVGTILVAPDLVPTLLGNTWEPIIVPLQFLSVAGLFRGLSGTMGPLFASQGRPSVPPRFGAARLVIMIILLPVGIGAWGIIGAAGVVAVSSMITGVAGIYVAFRFVHVASGEVRQALVFPAFNAAVMTAAVLAVQVLLPDGSAWGVLVVSVVVGVASYFMSVGASTRFLHYHSPSDLIRRVRKAAAG